jgi:seryl-tRNA synthetase
LNRGYFLKGVGVMLNMALINYGLSFLRKRGYTDIQPPYFIRREIMQETAELGDFSENLYQVIFYSLMHLLHRILKENIIFADTYF